MKVLGTHKSFFIKTFGLGILVTFLTVVLISIGEKSERSKLQDMSRAEALQYFESTRKSARVISREIVDEAAILFSRQLRSGHSPALATKTVVRFAAEMGFNDALFWYMSGSRNATRIDSDPERQLIQKELERLRQNNTGQSEIILRSEIYTIAFSMIGDKTSNELPLPVLVVALPAIRLYAIADIDKRIERLSLLRFFGPEQTRSAAVGNELMAISSADGTRIANASVKPNSKFPDASDIAGWEMVGLSLMPLLGLGLFLIMIYRHFEAFSSQIGSLRQVLRRDKPGMEIFWRDLRVVRNNIPELSEVYGLIEENLSEKTRLKRSLDVISATLDIVQKKGYDRSTVNEIVELITSFTGSFGGAVFTADETEDRIEIVGKFNFSDDLISSLCQTRAGISLFRASQKQAMGVKLSGLPGNSGEEPWRMTFQNYKNVAAVPLFFRSRAMGVLVLISFEPDPLEQLQGDIGEIIREILAAMIYGLLIENDKSVRNDKARILQETSLAISSTLELPSVLQIVATRLTEYAGATYCMILLNTDVENSMELASFHSKRQKGVRQPDVININLAEFPKIGEAMSSGRSLILGSNDQADFSNHEKRFFHVDMVKVLTIIPISHSARTIGAVVLAEERSAPRSSMSSEKLNFVQAVVSQAASAIENARLYGFIHQKVEQLTTLYNVSAAIHSEVNVTLMLDKVLTAIEDHLHFSVAAVFPVGDKRQILAPLATGGPDSAVGGDSKSNVISPTVSEKVCAIGEAMHIDDIRVEAELRASFPRVISELAVPIKIGDKMIGIFSIGSPSKCAFTKLDESFLKALAAQLAVAMERARLFDQERERGLKLRTIFDFSRKLSRTLNVQEVLKIASDSIQEAFHYHLVSIFMIDKAGEKFQVGHQSSVAGTELPQNFTVPVGDGLLGKTIKTGKTLYCPDVTLDTDYVCAIHDVRSEICIPIIAGEKVRGVLDVESLNVDDFTAEDISTLEALSDIMAVAIENSNLFEETIEKAERLALIDNINKAISATLDLNSFFRVVAKAVADNAGYPWTSLIVPEGAAFVFKAGYTAKAAGVIATEPLLEIIHDKLRSVIETVSPEFISFSQLMNLGSPERLQPVVDAGIRHLALFPIGDNVAAEAVMLVGSSRSDGFSHQELQLLKDLAVHLRIAWQNAQLYMQLKTAYDQLQEAQDRIIQSEKLRALGEMSSGVVHDFNNILAAILGRIQIIAAKLDKHGKWSGRQFLTKNLELIEKAANDGSHILSRISEFTKKKPTEKFVEIKIDRIIADTIELVRPRSHDRARGRGRSVEIEFHKRGDLLSTGSPSELREVFTNLILNAFDAISGKGKISINAWPENDATLMITIEDTGHGMNSETRKRIFEPFFTTKGAQGTGLGLSVAYGIIRRHKGFIEVESEPNHGAKFIIRLPHRKAAAEKTRSAKVRRRASPTGKILVVDDEESFREILVEILASGGHRADSAPDGAEALRMLAKKTYDVVVTDLGMTGLSGWELADAIYQNHPATKVVMATGWGVNLDKESLNVHHVHTLICKPFKIEEILKSVNDALLSPMSEVSVV